MELIIRLRQRIRRPSDDTLTDATYLAGLVLIVVGAGLVYGPAAFIVAGALLVKIAWRAGAEPAAPDDPTRVVERWYSDSDDVDEDA